MKHTDCDDNKEARANPNSSLVREIPPKHRITFWHPDRIQRVILALALALVATTIALLLRPPTSDSMIVRGDFPAFYSAAELVITGNGQEIYDQRAHAAIQQSRWPSLGRTYLSYAYPPYTAILMSPLAFLPPNVSKAAWGLIMFLCLSTALYLANYCIKDQRLLRIALIVLSGPTIVSIVGGQNSGLTILCLMCVVIALRNRQSYLLGLMCGLMFWKPQFGLVVTVICLLLDSDRRVTIGLAATTLLYYGMGTLLLGPFWPVQYISSLAEFSSQELIANIHQSISLPSAVRAAFLALHLSDKLAASIGLILMIVVVVLTVHRMRDAKCSHKGALLIFPALVSAAPSAVFYDSAIALFGYFLLHPLKSDRDITEAWLVFLVSLISMATRDSFTVSPLVLVTLFCLIRSYRFVRRG